MKHLLIDTNCWLDFIRKNSTEPILDKIEYWFNSGLITILVPNRLLQEWEKQSVILLKESKAEHDKVIAKSSKYAILALNADFERIQEKARRITTLLRKGLLFSSSISVKANVIDRYENRLAPFHKKLNSNDDATIYLSTLEQIKSQQVTGFYFLTRNINDFGEIGNESYKLHPDLLDSEVEVNYHTDPFAFLNYFGKGLPTPETKPVDQTRDYIKQFVLIDRSAKDSLTDILYETLRKHYDELPFIPTHILSRLFPFKIIAGDHLYTYFNGFTLSINNKDLDNYFRSIAITEENELVFNDVSLLRNTSEEKQKVVEIISKLNRNLVYNMNLIAKNSPYNIQLNETTECSCVRCSYNRMHFISSYIELEKISGEAISELMKTAYMQFEFGNYSKSLISYFKAYEQSKNAKKAISAFICLENCKKLKFYIEALHFEQSPEIKSLCGKLDEITLQDELISSSQESSFVQENIKWLSERGYINTAKFEIFDLVGKIRNHYNTQLSGGYSSNSNLTLVISRFAELESYLEQNNILISNDEIQEIFEGLVEGLFMSFKFNNDQGQRMISFDDYWLMKIAFYGKPDRLIRICQRLSISRLEYKAEKGPNAKFEDSVLRFIMEYKDTIELINVKIEDKGYSFKKKYQVIFSNILVLLNLVELGEESMKKITSAIIDNLVGLELLRKTDMIYLGRFIYKNGKYLSQESINQFIKNVIENSDLHQLTIFEALNATITKGNNLLISESNTYHLLINIFLKECPKCKEIHDSEILVNIYSILSDDFKQNLRDMLIKMLKSDFNPNTFYSFSIHGVIPYELFLEKFVELCPRPDSFNKTRHPFVRGENQMPRLGEILNLAFKYNVDLNQNIFQRYRGLSDYYDWLLDLEGFDYNKFSPDWVLQYPTQYYLEKIFSTEKVKNILKTYLIKNDNPSLRQYFIEYI